MLTARGICRIPAVGERAARGRPSLFLRALWARQVLSRAVPTGEQAAAAILALYRRSEMQTGVDGGAFSSSVGRRAVPLILLLIFHVLEPAGSREKVLFILPPASLLI